MHFSSEMLLLALFLPSYAMAGSRAGLNPTLQPIRLSRLQQRDRATYYDVGLGACGKTNAPNDFVVAMNTQQYGTGYNCFKSITIQCKGKSTQALIVDKCPGCPYGGLDLSEALFKFFEPNLGVGVLDVTWHYDSDWGSPPTHPSPNVQPPPPPPPPHTPSNTQPVAHPSSNVQPPVHTSFSNVQPPVHTSSNVQPHTWSTVRPHASPNVKPPPHISSNMPPPMHTSSNVQPSKAVNASSSPSQTCVCADTSKLPPPSTTTFHSSSPIANLNMSSVHSASSTVLKSPTVAATHTDISTCRY